MRILPVALIQNQPLIKHFPVQQNIRTVDPDLSHGKIGAGTVRFFSVHKHTEPDIIQGRILRCPLPDTPLHAAERRMKYICARFHASAKHSHPCPADLNTVKGDLCLNLNTAISSLFRKRHIISQLQRRIRQKRSHFYLI